jgi:lipoprotein-releasing system ATP-binding protein
MTKLEVTELRKEFATRAEPLVVLDGVSLTLEGGQSLAVVGPSGSGKSTLLHLVGTLDEPTSGIVRLSDVDPFALGAKELAAFRNANVGFVFQDHHLLPQLSVLENVLLPALAAGSTNEAQRKHALELIDQVGLAERVDHRPAELSGGERQRAAVARALLMKPNLVLADEPTGNLDQENADRIVDLLVELQQTRPDTILIVVTHSGEVASRMQQQLTMQRGRLVGREEVSP